MQADVERAQPRLRVHIEDAAYPNWACTTRVCTGLVIEEDRFSYRCPARPDGGVPVTVWRREAVPGRRAGGVNREE